MNGNMKNAATIISVFLLAVSMASCNRPGCAQKNGTVTMLDRPVTPFTTIVLYDNINMVITQAPTCSLVIETDESLQPAIGVTIENGQLVLRNNASCSNIRRPGEQITAHVSLPDLNRLDYQGSGTVTCTDTLHLDYLSVEADHGAGDVHLLLHTIYTEARINNEVTDFYFAGRSDTCYTWCASRGTIDFANFKVKRLQLAYAGIRDAHVWATEKLNATIYQEGNVFYKGTPVLTADFRNSGRLIRL
jgi:hypothetical protein